MPNPYYREFTKTWYVNVGGRQVRLGKTKDEAFAEFYELMSSGLDISHTSTVAQLLDAYLEWCLKHRNKLTYDNQKRYLKSFVASCGKKLKIAQLKNHHLTEWLDRYEWSDTSKNDAVATQSVAALLKVVADTSSAIEWNCRGCDGMSPELKPCFDSERRKSLAIGSPL